jgi:thiol-disulfide isomerase/thioredoxin
MKIPSPSVGRVLGGALLTLCSCGSDPAVQLQLLDFAALEKLVASHRGKIVVLDAWSTSCPPCVAEFPNLVALSRNYSAKGVACISVNFDYDGLGKPEDVQGKVLEFLVKHQAAFDNVLSTLESDQLLKKFKIYSLPAVFIYDRAGKLVKQFDTSTGEEFTYNDVEEFVASLVDSYSK